MADLDSLYRALEKADAAGDTESAKQLSNYIRSVTGYVTPPPPPPSKERTMGEAAKDIGAALVSGIGGAAQLPGQLYGLATGDFAETGLYGAGKKLEKYGEEMKSAGLKAREAERARKIAEAEKTGQFAAAKTAFAETVKDPGLLLSFLAEQAPQLLVPFAAARGVGAGARALGAAEQAAAKAGVSGAVGAGAVQQGADIGSGAYEDIYKGLIEKGASPDEAKQGAINLARQAGASAGVISLLVQRLPGARQLEEALAGVPGKGGRVLSGLKTAAGEAYTEIPEEVGGKVAQNIAARAAGLDRDILAGTGEVAGMAAVGGAGLGAVTGLTRRPPEAAPAPTPEAPPELAKAVQEPSQEERMAAAAARARAMPGFTGAPGADQAMLAARREADAAALAAEERAARIEDERLRKERQARIAEINNTTFSADPVQNEITKARLLAEIEPAPAPAEEAPEPEVTPPGEQGLEDRALEGFAGPAQINQRLIAERRAADEAAAKANEDMRKEMIQRINKTTFSADPVANEIAKRRALDELGVTEQAKPAERPAVTEAKEPPGLMTPIEKEQVKPRGEKFYPTSVDEQEELKTLKSQLAELKRASRPQESGTLYQALKGKLLARPGAVGPQDIAGDDKKVNSLFSKTGTVKTTIAGRPVSVQARTLEDMVADGELDEFLPPNKRVNLGTEANPDFDATESVGIILDMLRDEGGSTTPRFDESVRLRPLKEQRFEIEDRIAELEKLQEGRAKLAGVEPQTEFEDLSMDDLQAMAQQMGIDTEALAESVAFRNQGATDEQYQGELRKELISNINSERGGETETLAQQEGQVGNSPTEEGRAIQKQLEGKSVEQVTQWLIQNAKNPFQKLVARKVQALFRNLEKQGVQFSFKIESGNSRPRKMFAASGSASFTWAPDKTTVDITLNGEPVMENQFGYPSGMSYRTVMHEMLHAVTRTSTKYLLANNPIIVELRTLFNQVVDQYNKDAKAGKLPPVMQMYYKRMNNALANPDELISWGMTDEGMQDYLANINVGPKQTAYNKLVDLIRQVLGLAKPYESALEKLVRTTDSLLEVDVTYLKGSVEQHGYRLGPEKVAPKPISTGAQESLFEQEDFAQQSGEDVLKIFGAKKEKAPTPTEKGRAALELLSGMGRDVNEVDDTYRAKVQQAWNNAKDNPKATFDQARSGFARFMDKVQTMAFSSDAALINRIREAVGDMMLGQEEKIGLLLNTSLSQTVHSDAIANLFMQKGNVRYNTELHKWEGVDSDANFITLSRKLDEIAAQYGLTKQEVELVAHTALEAKRAKSLVKYNEDLLAKVAKLRQDAREEKAKGKDPSISESKQIAAVRKGDALTKEANRMAQEEKFVHLTPEEIQSGMTQFELIPELNEAVKIWNKQRENAVKVLVDSGLWTEAEADFLLSNADYVPFYREEQLEEGKGPKEFLRSLMVQAKEKKLRGSKKPVNDIFDNMVRWTQYSINRAVRNRSAVALADTAVMLGLANQINDENNTSNLGVVGRDADGNPKIGSLSQGATPFTSLKEAREAAERLNGFKVMKLEKVNEGDATKYLLTPETEAKNVVKVWKNGKQVEYSMEDPLFMEAFTGLESVSIPTIRWASKMADILRQSVVLYPAFAVSQLPQDSFAAMFTSGLKPQYALTIPLRAVKEFVQTLRGKSKAHEELKNFGVVGVRDFSSAMVRLDTEIYAGLKAPPGVAGKLKRVLGNIAMASDNAVRQATYEAAVAQGLSRAEALEKAFEIFNVRRKGSSRMLALAGQVIPFFMAYLAAQNVAYKTITGTGTSPTEREAAYKALFGTTASVMALSLIYAMMNADDDDYLNKPTPTRDRLLMIPGTGGMSIPLRADLYTVPKVLTEHLYLLLTDNGYEDAAKFRSSMASVLTSAILSPTPVPQVIKPLVEVAINYDFYQQKPLIGQFQKEKDVSRQFEDSTSELAKLFGKTELIPPIAVDHLVRGMLGTTGGLVLYTTNFFLQADSDVPRPQMSMRDAVATIPGVSGFVSKEYESALRKDFYELAEVTQRAAATLSDLKNRSPELIEDYVSDEKVAARLELSKAVNQIARDLTNIRRNITQVTNASEEDMTAAEKQEAIRDLREAERDLLKSVGLKEMREMAGL